MGIDAWNFQQKKHGIVVIGDDKSRVALRT
jgi:hypothetical protein